ncbi:MAG TPA: FkbM family methyltransferase [Alphaproteobacteria bacterium]|nr:FkbM family methyltransferase [Alphaproteobacteria bacterium]
MIGADALGLARSLAIYYGVPGRSRRLRRFYASFLKPGDLCFEIGAHVGHRLAAALAIGARVVALEPQPSCQRLLHRLYGGNPRATLSAEAVGEHPGTAILRISRATPTVSSLDADWIGTVRRDPGFRRVTWDRRIEVPVTTLDSLIARHGIPAYVKLDIEGSEPAALRGLTLPLPHLSFEALPAAPASAVSCIDRLDALGRYRFNLVRGETARFAWPDWIDGDLLRALLGRESGSADVHARLER